MTNYISQLVDGTRNVIIHLDMTVVGSPETIIGNPSEYLSSSPPAEVTPEFIGTDCDGYCTYCDEDPCDWSSLGHTFVDSVRAEN